MDIKNNNYKIPSVPCLPPQYKYTNPAAYCAPPPLINNNIIKCKYCENSLVTYIPPESIVEFHCSSCTKKNNRKKFRNCKFLCCF